jgi:peptide/nickel transport system permease protein
MVLEHWLRELMRTLKFAVIRIKQNPLSIIGASIIIFYIIIALLAPVLAPPGDPTQGGDPFKMPRDGFSSVPKPPSTKHPFGTTQDQWDIFYGCIWGTITAFRIGFSVVLGALAIGLVIGAVAGYFGGVIDKLIVGFADIFLSLPGFVFALAFIMVMIPSGMLRPEALILALVLVWWPSYTRIVRGEILRIKQENYAKAAEAVGFSNLGVIVKPIVSDMISPILIVPFLDIGPVVLIAATLGFLGLGFPLGYSEWGQIISLSRNWIAGGTGQPFLYWYTFVIPGLFLFFFVLGWILLGDAFRDVLDPIKKK